jgi:hypothetical protein
MQSLVPLHNIGTTAHPFYEGTLLNIATLFVSFPVAVLVYGTAAYIFLRRRQRYHGIQAAPTIQPNDAANGYPRRDHIFL